MSAKTVTVGQVTTAYGQQTAQVRARMLEFLLALWSGLPDYRDKSAAGFIRRIVPVVAGAQQQTARLTASYLSAVISAQTGTKVPPVAVRPHDVAQLRGVEPAALYQRPFTQVYTGLSEGRLFPAAVQQGRARLIDLAATDVQLAKTRTAQRSLEDQPGIVGYERVLTGDKSCGLCIVASTQRYHKADLLPIHPGCDCAVAPLFSDEQTEHVIHPDRLASVHAAVSDRFGQETADARSIDYRALIVTHQHGEIGPVITVRGQKFTGPDDLNGNGS